MTPTLRFDGQVAVVSGAGGNLGREYALLLAVADEIRDQSGYTVPGGPADEMAEIFAAITAPA